MSHSELENEGQQVQGFLNLLVETGALKMFETKSGVQTRDRTIDESIKVEDGILSRFCVCAGACVHACASCVSVSAYLCLCVCACASIPALTTSSRVYVCVRMSVYVCVQGGGV